MRSFLVVAAFAAVAAVAQAGQTGGYGAPAEEQYQSQTYRHVYVHSAPDEPAQVQSRTIRVPGGDKHVNIIFVKTPSQDSSSQTEVILPEQDEQKNLVYVLLKKGSNENQVNIRRPAAARQQKPEVYFIRYGNQQQDSGYGAPGVAPSAPISAPQPVRTPSSQYGAF